MGDYHSYGSVGSRCTCVSLDGLIDGASLTVVSGRSDRCRFTSVLNAPVCNCLNTAITTSPCLHSSQKTIRRVTNYSIVQITWNGRIFSRLATWQSSMHPKLI